MQVKRMHIVCAFVFFFLGIRFTADPVVVHPPVPFTVSERDVKCLADNIYYEAGNQPLSGKVAVAFVTLNRLMAKGFPSSVCGVVHQKTANVCQFSWVCERPRRFEARVYEEARAVAKAVVNGYNTHIQDPTSGALFFHTTYVKPRWRHQFIRTAQISDHIFYRL